MNVDEIKQAVIDGECVCWKNTAYRVICDQAGQFLIAFRFGRCDANFIGLTHRDGKTLNGNECDFFITETIRSVDT